MTSTPASSAQGFNVSIDISVGGRSPLEDVVAGLQLIEKEEADQLRVAASNSKSNLVRSTWAALKNAEPKAIASFHQSLNVIDPTAAQLFIATIKDKKAKLPKINVINLLDPLVDSINDMDLVIEKACPIGQDNAQRGIKSIHYSAISKALLQTIEKVVSKSTWTRQAREAWIWFFNIVADAMLNGARGRSGNLMYGVSNAKSASSSSSSSKQPIDGKQPQPVRANSQTPLTPHESACCVVS